MNEEHEVDDLLDVTQTEDVCDTVPMTEGDADEEKDGVVDGTTDSVPFGELDVVADAMTGVAVAMLEDVNIPETDAV